MLVGGVVEHEVEDQADALVPKDGCDFLELLHRAEIGIDRAIVAHRIATVVLAVGRNEERHQVQIREAELLEVGNVVLELGQLIAEEIDVQNYSDHLLRLKPLRLRFASFVEAA